jgi:hypothetical protein
MTRGLILILILACAHGALVAAAPTDQEQRRDIFRQIPPTLQPHWRKYGDWDYRQYAARYTPFTKTNFGSAGKKAGLSNEQILLLARVAGPTSSDITLMVRSDPAKIFASKRKELDELLLMTMRDDNLNRIAHDYTALRERTIEINLNEVARTGEISTEPNETGLKAARWNRYRELFKSVGLTEGYVKNYDYPDSATFVLGAEGLCVGGCGWGFIHSKRPLSPLTADPEKSLNELGRANAKLGSAIVFQKLEGDWYAFYEIDW